MTRSQDEASEMFVGEWAEKRGIRDQLFIATKVRNGHLMASSLDQKSESSFFPVYLQLQVPQ